MSESAYIECPHCRKHLHPDATVCNGCQAQKAYGYTAKGRLVTSRAYGRNLGIVLGVIALVSLMMALVGSGEVAFYGYFGLFLMAICYFFNRKIIHATEPKWFRES